MRRKSLPLAFVFLFATAAIAQSWSSYRMGSVSKPMTAMAVLNTSTRDLAWTRTALMLMPSRKLLLALATNFESAQLRPIAEKINDLFGR